MIREFTKAYQTSDGKIFIDKKDADAHEEVEILLRVIRQAKADARHDNFGHTCSNHFDHRFAEELIKAGFRLLKERM